MSKSMWNDDHDPKVNNSGKILDKGVSMYEGFARCCITNIEHR